AKKTSLAGALCLLIFWALTYECQFIDAQPPTQALSIIDQFSVGRDQLLCLPVTIEGRTFSFVLDTGCAQSALDSGISNLGKPLGFKRLRAASGAVISAPQYPGPHMSLGNIQLPNRPVIAVDLGMLRKVSGQDIHGILGIDQLKDFVCRLDFDAGKVLFL